MIEILPDIYCIRTPMPGNGLDFVNSYLIKEQGGGILVDTGWKSEEALRSLAAQLSDTGVCVADLRQIVITHAHPDHYGLVELLSYWTSGELVIHERENSILRMRATNYEEMVEQMADWLQSHDMPGDPRRLFERSALSALGMLPVEMPVRIVYGGEKIAVGDYQFEVIWTPGHSPGHICLYEPLKRVLITGDHVLPDTTPNVSMYVGTMRNPLQDYIKALNHIARLDVELVLPAHGEVFGDLGGRVDEILQHHEMRLEAIQAALNGESKTARQVAEIIPWTDAALCWQDLNTLQKRMALTETVSHLELLITHLTQPIERD
jgi:glyoxylase-like metal-dependent hydrolase (beta-lactamase superfamily II)